jgi:putative peptidoglycan lipid II flippase
VGLVVLAEPVARLLYGHGRFTADDVMRAARMIAVYSAAVWAYCLLPVLVRGFYALDDRVTPLRVAVSMVALNLLLDFTLIWPLGESGLAVSTAISAVVQVVVLAVMFSRRHIGLAWRELAITAGRTLAASVVMGVVAVVVLKGLPVHEDLSNALVRVVGPMAAAAAVYVAILALIGRSEWRDLLGRE